MESLLDLPGRIAHALIALALLLLAFRGPPSGPTAETVLASDGVQLELPFMSREAGRLEAYRRAGVPYTNGLSLGADCPSNQCPQGQPYGVRAWSDLA